MWTAIYKLLVIEKSDLSDTIKLNFFQDVTVSVQLYRCTTWTFYKMYGEKARLELHCFEQILEAASLETAAVWLLTFYIKNLPCNTKKT